MGFIKFLFWTVVIIIVATAWFTDNPPNNPKPVQQIEKTPEELAESTRAASVSVAANVLMDSLHNPNSVEWIEALSNNRGTAVCLTYRAKNRLGSMSLEQQAIVLGKLSSWKTHCAGKSLNDMSYSLK